MISIKGANLGYGTKVVLENVDCEINSGDFTGLVGPNGSGKTTLLRSVLNLIPPLSGQIKTDRSKRFAYVPQIDEINDYWPLTVRQVVSLALKSKKAFGRLGEEERHHVDEILKKTGIHSIADTLLSEVSGGQRQRTILAQALSQKPDVLLLDEPTRGLDVLVERDFLRLIQDMQKKENLTILLVTHALPIPLKYCEKILLFAQNKVISSTAKELSNEKKLEEMFKT